MSYLGASPLSSFSSPSKDRFSGNNSDTSFTMSQRAPDANSIEVFVAVEPGEGAKENIEQKLNCLRYALPAEAMLEA